MPLITISGLPLSGKSNRVQELVLFLKTQSQENDMKIIVVNEESLNIDKKLVYLDATAEKNARAKVLSSVEKYLNKDTIVICDYLNYIKGFRYQLYVIARNVGTPTCTIHCASQTADSLSNNESLLRYDPSTLENLCSRFEDPEGRNRWDAPLFFIIAADPPLSQQTNRISNEIYSALQKKSLKPNLSTITKPLNHINYLSSVDKVLSDIQERLIQSQNEGRTGPIKVPLSSKKVILGSFVSLATIRKIKRQFLLLTKTHAIQEMDGVADSFVEYINLAIQEE